MPSLALDVLPIHNDDIKDEANQAHQLTIVCGSAILQNPNVDIRMEFELKYTEPHNVITVHIRKCHSVI